MQIVHALETAEWLCLWETHHFGRGCCSQGAVALMLCSWGDTSSKDSAV